MECFICLKEETHEFLFNVMLCCNKFVHDDCLWNWIKYGPTAPSKLKCPACRNFLAPRDLFSLIKRFIKCYSPSETYLFSAYVVHMIEWMFNIDKDEIDNALISKMMVSTLHDETFDVTHRCVCCCYAINLVYDDVFELICCSTEDNRKLVHKSCLIEHVDRMIDYRPTYVGLNTVCPYSPNSNLDCQVCRCQSHKLLVSPSIEFLHQYRIESKNIEVKDLMSHQWCFFLKSYFLKTVLPTVSTPVLLAKNEQVNKVLEEMEWAQDNAMFDDYLDFPIISNNPPPISQVH